MKTVYDWFGYEMPIEERYRMIREAGFDGVLMWWSDGFGRGDDYQSGPDLARSAGLWIENFHAPFQDENSFFIDSIDGEAVARRYLQCIDDCAQFEVSTLVVHLPSEEYPHSALGLDRVKDMSERAEKLGVNIAFENIHNLPNLAFVLENVDSKRIGWCYDCGHHYCFYSDVDLCARYGDRLMALHCHDIGGIRVQHQLPFDGPIDWAIVMNDIAKTGYTGATAIEAMNWDYLDWTPEKYLLEAFKRAQKLEALREP